MGPKLTGFAKYAFQKEIDPEIKSWSKTGTRDGRHAHLQSKPLFGEFIDDDAITSAAKEA